MENQHEFCSLPQVSRGNEIDEQRELKTEKKSVLECIKAEVNLERLPFFAPWDTARKRKTEYTLHRTIERDGGEIKTSWTVLASPTFGLPNIFDLDVYRALQQLLRDQFPQEVPEKGIIPFTFRDIERRLNRKHSGRLVKDIATSLERMVATTVQSKGAFYYKGEQRYISETFHIFDGVTFVGEPAPWGGIAETNYLILSKWYLRSLKSWYVMPIDLNYHLSLKSSNAKILYGRLSFYFWVAKQKNQDVVMRKYSDLCEESMICRQPYFSTGEKLLEPDFQELIQTEFLAKVSYKPIDKRDAWIYFWPGPRVTDPTWCRKGPSTLPSNPWLPLLPDAQEEQQKSESPQERPSTEPQQTHNKIDELAKEFYQRLHGIEKTHRTISNRERKQVAHLVQTYGEDWFRRFIDYALEQKRRRWPEMATLNGAINMFADEFTAADGRRLEEQRKIQEIARETYLAKTLQPYYRQYFLERLKEIRQAFPEAYQTFQRELQVDSSYVSYKRSIEKGDDRYLVSLFWIETHIAISVFDRIGNPGCRVLDFAHWCRKYKDKILAQMPELAEQWMD